jgi:hypothetical protein
MTLVALVQALKRLHARVGSFAWVSKRSPIFPRFPAVGVIVHVDVGIVAIAVCAFADHHEHAVRGAFVDQAVAIFFALGETGAVSGAHRVAAIVIDEYSLARDHHEEFIFILMPVALGRPGPGFQHDMAHAEIRQTRCGREAAIPAVLHLACVEWRISSGIGLGDIGEVELGQRASPLHLARAEARRLA